jgi:hypothetical protein
VKQQLLPLSSSRCTVWVQLTLGTLQQMSQWGCPDGIMVDEWSRYSGCNVGSDVSKAVAWFHLLVIPPLALLYLYVALELYRHDPMSSPSRIQGMLYTAVGTATLWCFFLSNAAVDPQTPSSSKLGVSLVGGIGFGVYCVGGWRLVLGHYVASVFQMVSILGRKRGGGESRKQRFV